MSLEKTNVESLKMDIVDYLKGFLPILLDSNSTRKQLLGFAELPIAYRFNVSVHRSLTFEYVTKLINVHGSLWGANFEFVYSDYDPALSQTASFSDADIHIFWIDWRIQQKKNSPVQTAGWWQGRVDEVRKRSGAPLLVNNWSTMSSANQEEKRWFQEFNQLLTEKISTNTDVYLIDINKGQMCLGDDFFDQRNDQLSGYPFSEKGTLWLARLIGSGLLPAALGRNLKAVIVDLDNTIYSGVLGEDGMENLVINPGYIELQNELLELKRSGVILAISSKNELSDVKEMFVKRMDFPLKFEDFAVVLANWSPKSKNLVDIISELNIAPSTVLFVDDNPVELAEVYQIIPDLKLLLASENPILTYKYLSNYPGLKRLKVDELAELRVKDIQANSLRNRLKSSSTDDLNYLSSLKMNIRLFTNHMPHVERLHEMSVKFNQFNLNLSRLNVTLAREAMGSNYVTITVGLSDIFSDSGLVGAIVCKIDQKTAIIKEVLFSCRVLGRRVEDVAFEFLLRKLKKVGLEKMDILSTEGPKNAPAIAWLKRHCGYSTQKLSISELLEKTAQKNFKYPAKIEEVI